MLPHTKNININYSVMFCACFAMGQSDVGDDPCDGIAADEAFSPSPSNGEQSVPTTDSISWLTGNCTNSSQLYFGTASTPTMAEFQGQQTSPWTPPESLLPETTYYWQIVTFNANGPDTDGPIWSFTTQVPFGACCALNMCIDAPEDACAAAMPR